MKLISTFISGRVHVNRKCNLQIKNFVSSVNNEKLCLPEKYLYFFVSLHTLCTLQAISYFSEERFFYL